MIKKKMRKGCYPGQETIAKIFHLGTSRRALAVHNLAARVEPGASVDVDGKTGYIFFFQAEDGIRDLTVTGVQTCALPISLGGTRSVAARPHDPRHGPGRGQ